MIELNDRRLAVMIADMIDRRVEQRVRELLPMIRYGMVVGSADAAARTVAVRLFGQEEPSPGFVYREFTPEDGDRVRVYIDPKGDRYIDAILGRNASIDEAAGDFGVGGDLVVSGTAFLLGGVYGVPAPTVEVFEASGTWTKPDRIAAVMVEVVGGGGGGGGVGATGASQGAQGGSGGGGGYARKVFSAADLASLTSATVTVGTGGGGGAAGVNNGSNGNASSFAGAGITTVQGNGGGLGSGASAASNVGAAGGTGGTASGGDVNVPGGYGSNGIVIGGIPAIAGLSGSTPLGGGTRYNAAIVTGGSGANGTAYGTGGAGGSRGASQSAAAGGNGADGVVIVTAFYA